MQADSSSLPFVRFNLESGNGKKKLTKMWISREQQELFR